MTTRFDVLVPGEAMVVGIERLGVDPGALLRSPGRHGVHLSHTDPTGGRRFAYARAGSAGSALPADLVASARVVVACGMTAAISPTAAAAVTRAAELAGCFVHDPNHRPRLTDAATAGAVLRRLAPTAALVTPSWPDEARALLGLGPAATPHDAVAAVRALPLGADGVLVDTGAAVPAAPPPRVVNQTGAGEVVAGTVAARLAHGDDLLDAVRLGVAAAALSVQGQGGTGYLPSLEESRALPGGQR